MTVEYVLLRTTPKPGYSIVTMLVNAEEFAEEPNPEYYITGNSHESVEVAGRVQMAGDTELLDDVYKSEG